MRIRKNAQLGLRGLSQGSGLPVRQAHACQLNQSPWDVMSSFGEPEGNGRNPLLPLQFEGEDSLIGNGSLGDSMGAVESVASMIDSDERAAADVGGLVIDDNDTIKVFGDNEEDKFGLESEDRRHEQNEATKGKRVTEKQAPLSRRGRPRSVKRGSSSTNSNPYEFYYYSGFGPSWGKRRGERGGGVGEVISNNDTKEVEHNGTSSTHQNNTSSSSSSQINGNTEEFDFMDDEDDEEYEEDDGRRKRMRKPVKARSLKSLM
ncbi:hypothetical protein SLEP1_g9968 [Rubroshorea leprosula]|uniref:Uncharacterized protein n=1 Tax=Rubroshorea leprosula TaxID=152421 RepID=A0AAV5IHY3_9ROSI|nr:hypothetical protein SLEP1_g9968 [Rubroshorea leprosula]